MRSEQVLAGGGCNRSLSSHFLTSCPSRGNSLQFSQVAGPDLEGGEQVAVLRLHAASAMPRNEGSILR